MTSPEVDTSGPSLRLVLGSMAVVVIVLGVAAYWRYTVSENHFAATLADMDRRGGQLDAEGCIDAVLEWHAVCEANKPLCDNGVPQVLTHCLIARDRTDACEQIDTTASASAKWVYLTCYERDTPCRNKKHCPCADAYRALDSFCRHGQKGVAL